MPFYEKLDLEHLRHACNPKCHHCGDVYLCIKCQKDIVDEKSPSRKEASSEDDGIQHDNKYIVDRNTLNPENFVVCVVKTLIQEGFCVVKNLVSSELARKTFDEIDKAYQVPGKFTPGKLNNGAMNKVRSLDGIRGDSVAWLNGSSDCGENLSLIAKQMNKLALSLYHANGIAMNRISKSMIMASCFDGNGKAYKRHIDSARDGSLKLTFIYYLNEDFSKEKGGCLRIHRNSGVVDVPPELGSMIIFRSDKLVHEVLPTHSRRFAFTIWYMEIANRKAVKHSADGVGQASDEKLAAETSPKIYIQSKKIKTEQTD